MALTDDEERVLRIQAAAFLHAKHGLTQERVAEWLGVSQAVVSRMLSEAEGRKWLIRETRFNDDILADHVARIEEFIYELKYQFEFLRSLADTVPGSKVREIRIFESRKDLGETPDDMDRRLEDLARLAAPWVRECLAKARNCGVGWGKTIACVIRSMRELEACKKPIEFFPTCGEISSMSVTDLTEFSSSSLAAQLAQLMGSTQHEPPCLTGIPAVVPNELCPPEPLCEGGIRVYLRRFESYMRIFLGDKDRGPLVDEIDSILTSVGGADQPRLRFLREVAKMLDMKPEEVSELAIGDIGGALLERPGLTEKQSVRFEFITKRCTGMTREHYERIAREAAAAGRPGVTVCAIGANKAGVLREAVMGGLVNRLVIDRDLAEALDAELGALNTESTQRAS